MARAHFPPSKSIFLDSLMIFLFWLKNPFHIHTYFYLRQKTSVPLNFVVNTVVQLNKCETDPYFLQNFQYTTMFISAFCKICELNTELEIVFVLILKVIQHRCNFRFRFANLTKHINQYYCVLEILKKIWICLISSSPI